MVGWIELVYLAIGIYGASMGTYLFVREKTRVIGIISYLLVLAEIAYYFDQMVLLYAIVTVVSFLLGATVTYMLERNNTSEEKAIKHSLLTGFGGANVALLIIGLAVLNTLVSISASLLAFELTVVALEGKEL